MTELVKKGLTPESEKPSTQAKEFLGGTPSKETSDTTLVARDEEFLKAASKIIEEIRVGLAKLSGNASIKYLTSDESSPGLTQERRSVQGVNHRVNAVAFADLLNFVNRENVVYERNAA